MGKEKEMQIMQQGRMNGMQLALKIVKEGGIEKLEKEIAFRGRTGINLAITDKELDVACEAIKNMTFDTYLLMSMWTLHNDFGFGQQRCQRFHDRFADHTECMGEGLITWPDLQEQLKIETGIELELRYNDKNRKVNVKV